MGNGLCPLLSWLGFVLYVFFNVDFIHENLSYYCKNKKQKNPHKQTIKKAIIKKDRVI